jgi:hypothetical protein
MEIAIKFKPNVTDALKAVVLLAVDGKIDEELTDDIMLIISSIEDSESIKTILNTFDYIENVEEASYSAPAFVSLDPYTGSQWHLGTTSYATGAVNAWVNGNVGSDTIYVGVIDTGCFRHEDLFPNLLKADGTRAGYNMYNNNTVLYNSSPVGSTRTNHGTWVAGIIGGNGSNNIGGSGICWKVKLITMVTFNSKGAGASSFDGAKAITYLIDLKLNAGYNIVAINMSFSGTTNSFVQEAAINSAKNAGILCVAAAGNSGNNLDVTPEYPAAYACENLLTVGSIDSAGIIADSSNYSATKVDLFAPGVGITTTGVQRTGLAPTSVYHTVGGTSFAAPCVTGAAALYKAKYPSATWSDIKTAILNTVTPISALSGKCVTGGTLNVRSF